jgi:hypothetical protein
MLRTNNVSCDFNGVMDLELIEHDGKGESDVPNLYIVACV